MEKFFKIKYVTVWLSKANMSQFCYLAGVPEPVEGQHVTVLLSKHNTRHPEHNTRHPELVSGSYACKNEIPKQVRNDTEEDMSQFCYPGPLTSSGTTWM